MGPSTSSLPLLTGPFGGHEPPTTPADPGSSVNNKRVSPHHSRGHPYVRRRERLAGTFRESRRGLDSTNDLRHRQGTSREFAPRSGGGTGRSRPGRCRTRERPMAWQRHIAVSGHGVLVRVNRSAPHRVRREPSSQSTAPRYAPNEEE